MFKSFRHKFKTYRFFRNLILSYIAIFITVTLISLSLFIVANKVVSKQFSSLSSALLSTFAQNATGNIDTLNNLYLSVPQYFDIYTSENLDINQKLNLQDFFDKTIATNYILSASMFSIEDNYFITENNIVLDPKTYFYSYYQGYSDSFDLWSKDIYTFDQNPHYYFDTDNIVRYQRSYISNSGKRYNIIFLFNKMQFFNYVAKNKNIVLLYNGKCYGVNEDSCAAGQYYLDGKFDDKFTFNNSKIKVYKQDSGNSSFVYALMQSSDSLTPTIVWFYVTFGLNLLFYIIIGLFMALIMSSRHFKPIENIISILPSAAQRETEDNVLNLSKHVSSIMRQNKELHLLSQNYFSSLRSITLERLLCDYISPLLPIDTLLNTAGISFPYKKIFVCIYKIDSVDIDKENAPIDNSEIFYALKNVSIDVFQGDCTIEFTEISGLLACILNISENYKSDIFSSIDYIIGFFKEKMCVDLSYSINESKNRLTDISACYKNCISELENHSDETKRFLKKLNSNELISEKFNSSYMCIETVATRLIEMIKMGDGSAAIAYVEVQLHKSLHYAANVLNLKALLYDLLVSVMTASPIADFEYIDRFSEISDSEQLQQCFNDTLLKISENFSESAVHEESIADNIYRFICEKYSDINLSVQMIGAYCDKVPSYASKIFSNEFNVNLLIFIQLYRVNISIKLLKNTSMSINKISEECGFSNANVFIRTFKKHTNITPGQYRTLINPTNDGVDNEN